MLQIDSAERCSATEAIIQLNAILEDFEILELKSNELGSTFADVASRTDSKR